jgi:cell division transport system ATP-binding protein
MIRFTNVKKVYDNGTLAIDGVSMLINNGEFVFLVGPSGSGKSTIVKMLIGEEPVTEGSILAEGFDLNGIRSDRIPHLRRRLGVVFQDIRLLQNKTVEQNLEFTMRVVNAPRRAIPERVNYVLELVGLSEKKKCFPNELSGGEQQRVAIARALVNNPSIIVADEPTGNLDPERSFEIMLLLEKINELGTTVLVVTHEQRLVDRFQKRVIGLEAGRIVQDQEKGTYERK